jgi:hypothetical protein
MSCVIDEIVVDSKCLVIFKFLQPDIERGVRWIELAP